MNSGRGKHMKHSLLKVSLSLGDFVSEGYYDPHLFADVPMLDNDNPYMGKKS